MSQRFDIGVHYFLKGEYARAAQLFQEILQEEPAHARAWSYLGICTAHAGRAADAERALSRAIELSPTNGEAWFHLGVARSLRAEWPEAASAYRHAVALLPDDMVAWHRLGVALAESGEEDSASAAFERALVLSRETTTKPLEERLPPGVDGGHLREVGEKEGGAEAKSWIDLALSLLSLGEEEEALAAYDRAYALDPERASRSLFKPMLRLVTAAAGEPLEDDPEAAEEDEVGPTRLVRRTWEEPGAPNRPEVS